MALKVFPEMNSPTRLRIDPLRIDRCIQTKNRATFEEDGPVQRFHDRGYNGIPKFRSS